VNPLSILDVCPTLLYSLGLEIPEDLEGHLPAQIFEPAFLEAHPPRIGERTKLMNRPTPQSGGDTLSAQEEEAVLSRLKALGYIE
jgi:hypothetical protein